MNPPATDTAQRLETLHEMLRTLSIEPDPVASVNGFSRSMRSLFGDLALISVSSRGLPSGKYRVMRFLHERGVADEGFQDLLYAGDNARVHEGGFIGEVMKNPGPTVIREAYIPDDPVLGPQLAPYHTIAALPVFDDGAVRNWVIHMSTIPAALPDARIEFLFLQANLVGGVINNKRLVQDLQQAHAWIDREIEEIAEIQRNLLPKATPRIPGIRFAAVTKSFDRAGGDLYDIFRVSRDLALPPEKARWGIVIADGKGHGPAATVMVAMVSALTHSYHREIERPGELLDYLNDNLSSHRVHEAFLTAFVGILEPASGRLVYASAGHNMPLLRRPDGTVRALPRTGGVPLGVLNSVSYDEGEVMLEPDGALLLYTDGVTEAMGPNRALYGEERLEQVFARCTGTAGEMMTGIVEDIRRHTDRYRHADDQTLLLVRRKPDGAV